MREAPARALTVTKETILAAIDRGDVAYLRANRLTKKKTINTLFANTRDTFATAEKDAAGRKRLASATTLARAIKPGSERAESCSHDRPGPTLAAAASAPGPGHAVHCDSG